MKLEIISLCDAATDGAGKLNILGAFDTVVAPATPFKYQHMALALRIRFTRGEAGDHKVKIHFMDADGRKVIPDLDGKIAIALAPDADSAVGNLIINLNNVEFRTSGEHSINVLIDGVLAHALPLFVRILPPRAPHPPA